MVAGTIHMQMSWVCSRREGPGGGGHSHSVWEGARAWGTSGSGEPGGGGMLRSRRRTPSDVLAGKLEARDAQSPAENGMWSFRPSSWAGGAHSGCLVAT